MSQLPKRQTAHFCSKLQMLLASGLPLFEALKIIERQAKQTKYYREIKLIVTGIAEGESLSKSANKFLPALATGLIQAAERCGNLEETLGRLTRYFEAQAELEEKMIAALIYPAFVLCLSVLSIIFIIFLVLPGLKAILTELGGNLPIVTNILLSSSDFLLNFGGIILFIIVIITLIICRLTDIETIILNFPGVSRLFKQNLVGQSFATLATLLKGGVPIVEALEITTNTVRSRFGKAALLETKLFVENGGKLSAGLGQSSLFPAEAIQMIQLGEKSGNLPEVLVGIANLATEERQRSLKRFTTLLEPSMTLAVGVVVGLIVLAVFLPMVDMLSKLQ